MSCFAVLPVGGQSRRLGRPKALLPWRGRTLIEEVAALFVAATDRTLVVSPPDLPRAATLAEKVGASVLRLPEPTAEMKATLLAGLAWLEAHAAPHADDVWFLSPVDAVGVTPKVLHELKMAAAAHLEKAIVVPTFAGKRGHPALLRWRLAEALRALPAGVGVNTLLRSRPADTLELPTSEASILADLDTPEDYERLRRQDATR